MTTRSQKSNGKSNGSQSFNGYNVFHNSSPPENHARGATKYPFALLKKPHDGFWLKSTDKPNSVRAAARGYALRKKLPQLFSVQKKNGRFGCWRVK